MKTIVQNSSNLSKYLLEDDVTVTVSSDDITVGDPPRFIVADLNSENATVHENVTNAPSDWRGNKYLFDGSEWSQNPNWVDPNESEETTS